jgi:mitochondrial fission protein ELM1
MSGAGSPARDDENFPKIWLIVGDRLGDNAQAETLMAATGLRYERRYVRVKSPWIKGKPKVIPSLHHLELAASDQLAPPWPEVVVTVGRRLSMVALWVREQSDGRTRIVLVGKPSGPSHLYDLIITSSEVQIPPAPNVHRIQLPLLRVDEERVRRAADEWRERFAPLPRPLVGILVGGPTNPFVFNRGVTRRLLQIARQVRERGGTPYFTTSPRTPPAATEALQRGLPDGAVFYAWQRDAPDNPYHALLGLADEFVVTGESVSMLVEVAKLGRPLAIFPLPFGPLGKLDQMRRVAARWLYAPTTGSPLDAVRAALRAAGDALHLLPRTRDFTAVHQLLISRGLAVQAGGEIPPPRGVVPNDLPGAVARIRDLLGVEA